MIPTIASGGSSFKGAALYYLQDKKSSTRDRVDWAHVENLPTSDPDKAVKVMAWTAMHQAELKQQAGVKATGRKLEKPVFTFSLSWHPEEKPEQAHMLATAKSAVDALGLSEYQALYVAHNDEPQKHVHVMINRVHPENGKAATLSMSKEKLSQWAHDYEKEQGKIYCHQREEKAQAVEQGNRKEKYCDPVIVQAWERSDSGKAFVAALQEQGYHLAQGNNRQVIVDKYGKAFNPVRLLEGVKVKDFRAKINDLDLDALPKADDVQKQIKDQNWKEYQTSRRYDLWSAKVLNETQDRQIDERASLFNKHHRQIERKKKELGEYYQVDELTEKIDQLKQQVEEKPGLWKRLTGKAQAEAEDLHNLERQMQNVEQRTGEQISVLEKERDRALEQQRERHEEEKQRARELIERKRPEFYRSEQEQNQSKEHTQQQHNLEQGRERGSGFQSER